MKKNVLIFGDSYSTFEDHIPEGYAIYYKNGYSDTDVTAVTQTWWHQVMEEADMNLVLNNSWSGSTVGYTGYGNSDCSQSSSFIYRLRQLIAEGFFARNTIDTVFVFGGTNDSWCEAPLGEMKLDNWREKDLYCVLPAIGYFLHLLKETLPWAQIYCLINTRLKPEITACMERSCEVCGITPVRFAQIDKESGHPTVQGMLDIKNGVLKALKA